MSLLRQHPSTFSRRSMLPALWLLLLLFGWAGAGEAGDTPPVVYHGHGGQGSVSGSLHVLEVDSELYLIDVGSFVGNDGANYPWPEAIPVDAVEAVFITHAHADHLGRLPLLLAEGYRGPIFMTRVTHQLARLTLPANLAFVDLGPERFYYSRHHQGRNRIPVYLAEHDPGGPRAVQPENRVYFTASRPELGDKGYYLAHPQRDKLAAEFKERLAAQVEVIDPGRTLEVGPAGLRAEFLLTSHIPGSAMLHLSVGELGLLFSGDVGADSSPLLPPNRPLAQELAPELSVDILFLEGTMAYDRRGPPSAEQRRRFGREVAQLVAAGKRVVIPAFVLDRSQQVMYELSRAMAEGKLPEDQVIRVCSPTANRLLRLYDDFAVHYRKVGWSLYFTPAMAEADFRPPGYVDHCSGPQPDNPLGLQPGEIGIMASGMADYSAARQALLDYLEDPDTVFYFVGYQAPASPGGQLTAGPSPPPELRLGGERRRVRAAVYQTRAFASHADPATMVRLFGASAPARIFLVHLAAEQGNNLAKRYSREFEGAKVEVPRRGGRYRLN